MGRKPELVIAVLVAALVGCSSGTAPNPSPIVFVSGNHQTDTIETMLSQPLVVRVALAPRGQSVARKLVEFQTVPAPNGYPEVYLPSAASDTTNVSGQVTVPIGLGEYAGPAKLVVLVPAFGYVDTARFTVLPGRAVRLVAGLADTTLYVSGKATMRTVALDRFSNRRSDTVTYTVLSGPATVSGSTVTATAIGRIAISGSVHGILDTSYVSGVPAGTIAAASDSGGIVMFNLDGSGYKHITSIIAGTVKWAPNGTSLVLDQSSSGPPYGPGNTIQSLQLNGSASVLVTSTIGTVEWPAYTRDGSDIYFVNAFTYALHRIHADGTGDTVLLNFTPEIEQFPSPSPDGKSLVYMMLDVIGGGGPFTSATMHVLTLSTLTSTELSSIVGVAANWSPTSNVIAYVSGNGGLYTVTSDGTTTKFLAPGPYSPPFDWSPDASWLIARNQSSNELEIINVSSRLVLPIAWAQTVASPTWR